VRKIIPRPAISATRRSQQRSGARHQLASECRKLPSRPVISSTSATRRSQTTLGGSTTTSPPIVVVILRHQLSGLYDHDFDPLHRLRLRQQLDYVIIDYAATTMPHPIKAKFSSSKSRLLFTFAAPDPRGLRHEQSSCIALTSKSCESPSSWLTFLVEYLSTQFTVAWSSTNGSQGQNLRASD
jgi:hypothetical protein